MCVYIYIYIYMHTFKHNLSFFDGTGRTGRDGRKVLCKELEIIADDGP